MLELTNADGWRVMETAAGKAVFKVLLPMPLVTTLKTGLSTITWQRGTCTRSDLHTLDAATRMVLISITYQLHRFRSVAGTEFVETLHCPSHIPS